MGRRPSRIYVPLDANFFDDDKVLEAGEAAGWLYLAMCAKAKRVDTDGILTRLQVESLHIKGWQKRMERLIAVELIATAADSYGICGWLNWNDSVEERAAKREADRLRKGDKK